MKDTHADPRNPPEPRWPAAVALLAVCGLQWSLPESFTIGPGWLLPAMICILLVPTALARRRGSFRLNEILGYLVLGLATTDMLWSLWRLLHALPQHSVAPQPLLRAAIALWATNILVFASWYWRLDAGGPHARDLRPSHTDGDFLFPQMTLSPGNTQLQPDPHWSPGFIDYLFLAFNTSTAFSPTDVPVLSRWAKVLMMIQASISFGTVALLAARAVNIL